MIQINTSPCLNQFFMMHVSIMHNLSFNYIYYRVLPSCLKYFYNPFLKYFQILFIFIFSSLTFHFKFVIYKKIQFLYLLVVIV